MDSTNFDENIIRVGEAFDSVITLDVSCRGIIDRLYSAARRTSSLPLSLSAGKALVDNLGPGKFAFLVTGSLSRSHFSLEFSETDGPIGIASLALTLRLALGVAPVVVLDQPTVKRMERMLGLVGFSVVPIEVLAEATAPARRPTCAVSVITMSENSDEAAREAKHLIQVYQPGAVISCERQGPNRYGILHNAQGKDTSRHRCRVDRLFEEALGLKGGPITVAFGDGGNEIGMGNIADTLKDWLPFGTQCQCPCKGGVIPETKVDILVPATVSNWGAYAVAAAIAFLTGKKENLPNQEREARIIRACANAGFIDSPTGMAIEQIDGLPMPVHLSIVGLLEEIAASGFKAVSGASPWDKPTA